MNNRQLFDVRLEPTQGSRFAPTGFPDLGAALFQRPSDEGWEDCLLVESAQSMANRLEATIWDAASNAPVEFLARLPYVRVVDQAGRYITSSRTESHRLASPYVRMAKADGKDLRERFRDQLGLAENDPLDYQAMARTLLQLDPLTLVHGVFFAGKKNEFPGQPKFPRILTAFIEAVDVRRAESGGVKRDHVSHSQKESGSDATEGYGSIPFQRTEWTARSIVASFNIDIAQLDSYGLPEPAANLILGIAQYEIAALLANPLRLRTNCDLHVIDDKITDREGALLPSADELATQVSRAIDACSDAGLLGEVIKAVWTKPKSGARQVTDDESGDDGDD